MFSLRLTLLMQIISLFMRTMSSVIWIQIYRLGVSSVDNTSSREADFDLRNSFFNPPTPAVDRQTSNGDDMLGGSIYDPVYYSSLFENVEDNGPAYRITAICRAKIVTIYHDEGWSYLACPTCRKKPNLNDKRYWCRRCRVLVDLPILRYKIQDRIKDAFAKTDATVTWCDIRRTINS